MSKGKLAKFAEMAENPLVVECPMAARMQEEFPLRGKWHAEFFHNQNPIVLELGCGRGEYTVGLGKQMPEKNFTRRRLSVEEIVAVWQPILAQYPDKQWLFTVSPIRHIRDGLHENQLSKATLLMAVDQMVNSTWPNGKWHYFPSYEILLDELRDYRFFADDLVHPSTLAVEYIWERFCETFCTSQTINAMNIAHKEWKFAHHRPLHEA